MSSLIERIEAAGPDEQRELLEMVWDVLTGTSQDQSSLAFAMMLDAKAYESAALMMMPEGERRWSLDRVFTTDRRYNSYQARICIDLAKDDPEDFSGQWIGEGTTPALALCAAILRTKEQTHDT